MSFSPNMARVGYSRSEFGKIFQIYSQNVYAGLFKDFSFTEAGGQYFISFREEAGQTPLITIEKRRIGPDRALFIATTPDFKGGLREIVRSEKIDAFTERLKNEIARLKETPATRARLRAI
jgi:hypothetical protein